VLIVFFCQVRILTKQIDRVYQTIRLLQSVIKYLSFVKKLQVTSSTAFKEFRENKQSVLSLLSSPSSSSSSQSAKECSLASLHDLPKIALFIQNLEEIREENESVCLVEVVKKYNNFIDEVKMELIDFTKDVFLGGIRSLNQNQISIAIRVFSSPFLDVFFLHDLFFS